MTVEFSTPRRPGVVLGGGGRGDLDFGGDDFGGVRPATVLAGPMAPPGQPSRRSIRYDLLAGVALLIALLALVPLLYLRDDPEEIPSTPKVPAANGADPAGDVVLELAEPVDQGNKVQLTWDANRELDFYLFVAAEGEDEPKAYNVQRNRSHTVDIVPGRKYCFLVQGTDGDGVYKSEPQPLRGAKCRE